MTTTEKPHWHSDILKNPNDGVSNIYRWKGNFNGFPTVVEIFNGVQWLPCKNLEMSKIIAEKLK